MFDRSLDQYVVVLIIELLRRGAGAIVAAIEQLEPEIKLRQAADRTDTWNVQLRSAALGIARIAQCETATIIRFLELQLRRGSDLRCRLRSGRDIRLREGVRT